MKVIVKSEQKSGAIIFSGGTGEPRRMHRYVD